MLKKWIAAILALGMLASFTACADSGSSRRDRDDRDEKEEQEESRKDTLDGPFVPGDAEFPDASDAEQVPAEPEVSYEDQIALIVSCKDTWCDFNPYSSYHSLAITDLDQNGHLELVISVCEGSGFFSTNYIYEVNDSLDGLDHRQTGEEEFSSQLDLSLSDTVSAFFDAEENTYFYAFIDSLRSGWAWNGSEQRALCLKDGTLTDEFVAARSCENFEDGSSVTTYYDADSNEISEEEYENAMREHFSHCEELTATFLWQSKSVEELESADSETLTALFEESWQGFSLN